MNVMAFCLSFVLVFGALMAFDASQDALASQQIAQNSHKWCPPRDSQISGYDA
jgi:hypothetical protein